MKDVYLLQHVHDVDDGAEEVNVIGIDDTGDSALAAVERVMSQPGFCDYPDFVIPRGSSQESGFNLDRYPLNQDHWSEGFVAC
jgi:hypothetical protein